MKAILAGLTAVLVVCLAEAGSEIPANLTIKPRCWSNGNLELNASVCLDWGGESPLVVRGYKAPGGPFVADATLEITDQNGVSAARSAEIGGASAFETTVSIKAGEKVAFAIADNCMFTVKHSGPYSVSGRLRGASVLGKPIVVELTRKTFMVEIGSKDGPNQSSEPTLASGTSPAGQEPRLP
jgi:hypothetical protein